jgi:hypothetical protein
MRKTAVAVGVSVSIVCLLVLARAQPTRGQGSGCSERVVSDGVPPTADDAFTYMPAYGKPMVGRPAMSDANRQSFSGRTNVTRAWQSDHRTVATPSGDMAYERGTIHMGYDEGGKRTEFDAVMLMVYRAKNGVCEMAALTMYPLDGQP